MSWFFRIFDPSNQGFAEEGFFMETLTWVKMVDDFNNVGGQSHLNRLQEAAAAHFLEYERLTFPDFREMLHFHWVGF